MDQCLRIHLHYNYGIIVIGMHPAPGDRYRNILIYLLTYMWMCKWFERVQSTSFINCQKKEKQIQQQQPRQLMEDASDDDSDYVEPDDHYETLPEGNPDCHRPILAVAVVCYTSLVC